MNKRTRWIMMGTGLLTAVILVVLLFLLKGKSSYRDSLPAHLQALARLDAGLVQEQIPDLFPESLPPNVSHCGIDFSLPLYAFVDDTDHLGVLLPLSSASQWEDYLQGMNIPIEKQRGYRWACHDHWLMVFSDDRCLMHGPLSEQEIVQIRGRMAELMKQRPDEEDLLLTHIEKSDAPLSTVFSLRFAKRLMTRLFPSSAPLWRNESEGCISMDVHAKDRMITADVAFHDVSAQSLLPFLTPIPADGLPQLGEQQMAAVTMGMNGEALLQTLRSYPSVRTALLALNFCLDLDQIIRSVDGPVTLFVPDADDVLSATSLVAQLRDTRFMQNSNDWEREFPAGWGIRMEAMGDSAFSVHMPQQEICFGVKDSRLIVASSKQAFHTACSPSAWNPYGAKAPSDDCLVCVQLDIPALLKHAAVLALFVEPGQGIMEFLSGYDTFVLRMKDYIQEEQ